MEESPEFGINKKDIEHLRAAIVVAGRARAHGNHPFGAVLVNEHNQIVLEAENTVNSGCDVTGHAETNLVRLATHKYSPEELAHFSLYTSTEPCVMCAGAIHWSKIGRVVYALSETDLYEMAGTSPENLLLPCREVFAHSKRLIAVAGPAGQLDAEAREVHAGFWQPKQQGKPA